MFSVKNCKKIHYPGLGDDLLLRHAIDAPEWRSKAPQIQNPIRRDRTESQSLRWRSETLEAPRCARGATR